MKIIRAIRKQPIVNKLGGLLIKKLFAKSVNNRKRFGRRWPPIGEVPCNFLNHHFKLLNKADDGLVSYFYYELPYPEAEDLKLFIELAKSSHCTLDIGANTGLFSILAAQANPASTIYAFEPYTKNAERLSRNIQINELNNIQIIEEAVSNKIGYIDISVPVNESISDVSSIVPDFSNSVYPNLKWTTAEIKATTLNEFRNRINQKIDLVKCDVETAEMLVFDGMKEVLEKDRPIIMFECFLDDIRKEYFDSILRNFSYVVHPISKSGLQHASHSFVPNPDWLNYLIVPVERAMVSPE